MHTHRHTPWHNEDILRKFGTTVILKMDISQILEKLDGNWYETGYSNTLHVWTKK